jgi:hypothetical protein
MNSRNNIRILLGYFSAKVGWEDIFKPTVRNGGFQVIINDNGFGVVNYVSSKYLIVKSKIVPHFNILKCTWTVPNGKTFKLMRFS